MSALAKKIIGVAGLLVIALMMLIAIMWLYQGKSRAEEQNKTLTRDIQLQAKTISLQSLDFNRFNVIAGDAQNANANSDQQQQEREIEIHTEFQKVYVRNECIPVVTSDRLLYYAARLRSSAMYPDQPVTDSTDANPFAGSCLTYENSVKWIDRLLTALDKANTDKAAIREQERSRQENYKNYITDSK